MATTYRPLLEAHRVSDRVLLISPDPEDAVFMREIVSTLGCQLESASDRHEAELALRRDVFGVVIAERDLHDGDWRDVLSCLERYSYNPLLIVVSRLADERLWAEVLNRCGFDVLAKPFAHEEATRVIGHALNTWNRRFDKEGRATIRDSATRLRAVGGQDAIGVDAFAAEVFGRPVCGGKVERRQPGGDDPIHFLRERLREVAGAQPRHRGLAEYGT